MAESKNSMFYLSISTVCLSLSTYSLRFDDAYDYYYLCGSLWRGSALPVKEKVYGIKSMYEKEKEKEGKHEP